MALDKSFISLLSAMSPVAAPAARNAGEKSQRPLFKLELADGRPVVTLLRDTGNKKNLSPADARIINEIMIQREEEDIFASAGGFVEIPDRKQGDIWKNPYLFHLMLGSSSILAPDDSRLVFTDVMGTLVLAVAIADGVAECRLLLRVDDRELPDPVMLDDSHVLCGNEVYEVRPVGDNYASIASLVTTVDLTTLPLYLTLFLSYVGNVVPEVNGNPPLRSSHKEKAVATLYLEKVGADKALYLRTAVSLDSLEFPLPQDAEVTRVASLDEAGKLIVRDVKQCDIEGHTDRLYEWIVNSAPDREARKEIYRDNNFIIVPEETAGPFLLSHLPDMLDMFRLVGSEKLKEYKISAAIPRLKMNFSSGIDFLEGEGEVEIGKEHFSIAEILRQISKKRYVQLSDGNKCIIDRSYVQRLQRIYNRRDKNGRIRINLFDLPEVEELLQSKLTGEFANRSRAVLEGFNTLSETEMPPVKVDASLRPYQAEGVKWLSYLFDNKLGGCLADDMGLGKTLETIALLSLIYPGSTRRTLIIMPQSLLFNWEKELDRFAPQLTHRTYYGLGRDLEEAMKADIVLTSYAVARNDILKLKEKEFALVVLDESQNIKNLASQTALAIQMLHADHRLALSGTPMENNLTELYSLFRFLNPTMFGSAEEFNSAYTIPIQKFGDKDATRSLRRKIFPFILRRLKKDVLDELPPRIDQTIYVEMTEAQSQLYNERRLAYKREIAESIARDGVEKTRFILFQALNELRRIASVPESFGAGDVASPKIDELVESISQAVSNGHKSVVFFNFLAGLEIVSDRLEELGIEFESMTGATAAGKRKRSIENFQSNPDCKVLLMTLKVGGIGLNLTAADTVYIFEPWWNKAAQEQAIDRLHRIGQKKTVSAFSLITVGTIEEKILQLQEMKSELFNDLISADTTSSKQLSEKDIDFILS